jgi:hypothetical protein
MTELKYIGIIEGMDTWEVYQDKVLIGLNQSQPQENNEI